MIAKKTILNLSASVLILIVGVLITQYLLSSAPQAQKQARPQMGTIVETVQLAPSSKVVSIPLIGTLEAAQKTTLSSKVAGKIIQTHPNFMLGSIVKKGELLAQIDPIDYQATLDQIKAQLLSAQASETIEMGQQESAKKELELSGESPTALSRSLMLREPQLAQVRASIAQLEASYVSARNNLKETTIKAPYDGVIVSKSAELGAYVSAQSNIVELVSTDTFWMSTTLPLAYLKFFDTHNTEALLNTNVTLFADKKPLHVKARILKLLPELDSITKQAKLLIAIDDPLGLQTKDAKKRVLLLGDTLEATLQAKAYENIITLPASMLRANNTVWVMDKNNTLQIKPVNVLFKNANEVLISEGIEAQDRIISTYLSAPVAGMKLLELSALKEKGK
jgi:RND family efflux transporter MFP subunit